MNENEQWNYFENRRPDVDELVIILRFKNKKYMNSYTIARLSHFQETEERESHYSWVTQQSCVHEIDLKDVWIDFNKFSITQTHTFN